MTASRPLRPSDDVRPAPPPEGRQGLPLADRAVVVRQGRRPVGVLLAGEDVRWEQLPRPAGAVMGRAVVAMAAVAGLTAVGLRWANRPARSGPITMGPGGWVSVKGAKPAADPGDRPWWARLLRSYRL